MIFGHFQKSFRHSQFNSGIVNFNFRHLLPFFGEACLLYFSFDFTHSVIQLRISSWISNANHCIQWFAFKNQGFLFRIKIRAFKLFAGQSYYFLPRSNLLTSIFYKDMVKSYEPNKVVDPHLIVGVFMKWANIDYIGFARVWEIIFIYDVTYMICNLLCK